MERIIGRPGQGPAPPGAAGVPVADSATVLPLASGDQGEAVADLQRRLCAAGAADRSRRRRGLRRGHQGRRRGLPVPAGPARRRRVRIRRRGRPWSRRACASATGSSICDDPCCAATTSLTCSAAVGAGLRHRPRRRHLRRADAPRRWPTSSATSGLPVDGILGASTFRELRRVAPRHAESRAREHGPRPRPLAPGPAHPGSADASPSARRAASTCWWPRCVDRSAATGAHVVPLLHPDGSTRAAAANAAQADVYLGLRLDTQPRQGARPPTIRAISYESAGGRRLAELVHALAAAALGVPCRRRPGHDAWPCCARPACRRWCARSGRPPPWSATPAPWPGRWSRRWCNGSSHAGGVTRAAAGPDRLGQSQLVG